MILSVQWTEWLRRPAVQKFDAASPIPVEDYLQWNLPPETTSFVFDDADRPMLQSVESQWGNGRFSTKKLAEIYNALLQDKTRKVDKFTNRESALQHLALEIMRQGKAASITNLRNHVMITENDLHTDHETAHSEAEKSSKNDYYAAEQAEKVESPAEMKKRAAAEAKAEKEAAKVAKAEAVATAKAEKEQAKADAKAARDEARAAKATTAKAPRAEGVIGSLIGLLTDGNMRTVDELYDALAEKFPDRGEGMKTTVRVQLARLGKEGRLVVHAEDRHDAEGKKLVGKNYWGESVSSPTSGVEEEVQEAAE